MQPCLTVSFTVVVSVLQHFTGALDTTITSGLLSEASSAAVTSIPETTGIQVNEDPCAPGGFCTNTVDGNCTKCRCVSGFWGPYCNNRYTRINGFVTYNTTLAESPFVLNISFFENTIKSTFPTHQEAKITLKNSTLLQSITIDFVVYISAMNKSVTTNLTTFVSEKIKLLSQESLKNGVFNPSTGVSFSLFSADVDECFSKLDSCSVNAKCFNKNPGYTCVCNDRYFGNGTLCKEINCLLQRAPKYPTNAIRTIFLANGTDVTHTAHIRPLPYKTFIQYTCPARYELSIASSGKSQVIISECVGGSENTFENSGWSGNSVSCNMELGFTIAIVTASISCVIIVLIGGGFLVSCTTKKKTKDDTEALDLDNSSL